MGVTLGGLWTACVCFAFSLLQAGLPVQTPHRGVSLELIGRPQYLPVLEQTRDWSAAPHLSGLSLDLCTGSSRSVPGVRSRRSLERCDSRTVAPRLGSHPSRQPCDVSLLNDDHRISAAAETLLQEK